MSPSGHTLLDSIAHSLRAAGRYHAGVEEPPVAILWTDADGQWLPLLPTLRLRLPQLLALGDYIPNDRQGPAIWLKCVLAGTIDVGLPKDSIPVLYLPKVSRQILRAAGDCPPVLQPLVELQYRGTVWTQRNGKDWTVEAFLISDDGLGLDMAKDDGTRRSLHAALPMLAQASLDSLRSKRLEAEDFDRLMVGDHPRDLLEWMNDSVGIRSTWPQGKWHAFRSRCLKDYAFDPEGDGPLGAAEKMGLRRQEPWKALWDRFCEAPSSYKFVPALLSQAKPKHELLFDGESWPDENDRLEAQLRASLQELEVIESSVARGKVLELEQAHGVRRDWVWARLGKSPLALALLPLVQLVEATTSSLDGASVEEMARRYEDGSYEADASLWRALGFTRSTTDKSALQAALRSLYLPWARSAAERFQEVVSKQSLPTWGEQPLIEAQIGECLLFADGLRFDLGQQLRALCEERGLQVIAARRWAALPTVTATAKPAVSPITRLIEKHSTLPESFAPSVAGQELTTARFRKALDETGYQYLAIGQNGDPTGKAWTECGQIDRRGHDLQIDLVYQLNQELEKLAERVIELLAAGWNSVRVITDHGWLLMPGGLPKCDLPGFLVASRWSRCAVIKGESKVNVPKATWHWNPLTEVAVAPGIQSFVAGQEYAHGGLSIQECLIPDLKISLTGVSKGTASIKHAEWQRLRCRVTVEPACAGIIIDLRTKAGLPNTSLVSSPKSTDSQGQVTLFVPDEDYAGTAAFVVAVGADGELLSKRPTTIGES
jgi:hypothetical protein